MLMLCMKHCRHQLATRIHTAAEQHQHGMQLGAFAHNHSTAGTTHCMRSQLLGYQPQRVPPVTLSALTQATCASSTPLYCMSSLLA